MDRPFRIDNAKYGKGLFATERIEAGTCLGKVHGKVCRPSQITEEQSRYAMWLGRGKVLYPFSPFRNLNHSCNPNAQLSLYKDEMYVEVKRTIMPGQQITIDYGWDHTNAIPCGCGSRLCRGWVVAADELHLVQETA